MFSFRTSILFAIPFCAGTLVAADASWRNKPAVQWSDDEVRQILNASPWAKQVNAAIAPRLSEDQLREGGQMGQPHGVGYDGVDPKGSGPKAPSNITDIFVPDTSRSARSVVQPITLRVRWESALPVRLAELKSHEIDLGGSEGDSYCIAVYGVPGTSFNGDPKKLGEPLKKDAFLKREGKKDVRPSDVEVFQPSGGIVVVYRFPLSAEISKKDGRVTFEAHIGRIVVSQAFDLSEMVFLGNLEL